MNTVSVDNIVTFFLTIIAVIYTVATIFQALFSKKRQENGQNQEVDDDEQEMTLQEYLESLGEAPKPKKVALPPAPPRIQKEVVKKEVIKTTPTVSMEEKFEFYSRLEDMQSTNSIEDRKLAIHLRSSEELVSESLRMMSSEGVVSKKGQNARIKTLIKSLPQEQLLFLSYEVFHVPVSRREIPFPWNG